MPAGGAASINASQIDGLGCTTTDNLPNCQLYVILWLQSKSELNLVNTSNEGEYIHITIHGTVTGATNNWNWPHFCYQDGQGGSGVEENKTSVNCGANCAEPLDGVSKITCDNYENTTLGPGNLYCYDQMGKTGSGMYNPAFNAMFTIPTGTSDMFKVEIDVTAPAGTADSPNTALIYSVGTHLTP